MALNNTYFESKGRDISVPIPDTPGYTPPTPPTPPTPGSGSEPVIPRPSFSGTTAVVFYNNSSEPKAVNKNITNITQCIIDIKDFVDLIDPVIYINKGDLSSDIIYANYMNMQGRYYYINSIECMAGNLYKIKGHVDVLMSYAGSIKNHSALIRRSANNYNKYLFDDKVKTNSYEQVKTLELSSGFNKTLSYLLCTIGGVSNV